MDLPVVLTTNAKMFAGAFNSVAMICHSPEFKSVINMGLVIGLTMTTVVYVKGKDVMAFAKWLALYIFVTVGLLGASSTCWISSTTQPNVPPIKVDNVPVGMAVPAYLFTQVGTGLAQLFEEAFASPDDPAYTKTGMLFGSNLFRLSLGTSFDNPTIKRLMNRFVARCVIGDITISHKYTYSQLVQSQDIWKLISTNTSHVRGFYYFDGNNTQFVTCQQAVPIINKEIATYVSSNDQGSIFNLLKSKMNRVTSMENRDVRSDLTNAANTFLKLSTTATELIKQNYMISRIRDGVKTMAADSGNTADMQRLSDVTSMLNQRMKWSTAYHIGTYDLPIMQTILLLLAFCTFPLVCVLSLLPNLSINIFKNFIYGIVWLETWPLLYSILNFAITFYAHNTSYVDAPTLSNINRLAQEHSDIAGMAGYLILSIPFISTFLVRGMASVFAQTAQYIGSAAHGSAASSAAMAASGNYSFGNVSMSNASMNNQNFDNINAHKHDTNATDMHGLSSHQMANGSVETTTASGGHIFNTTPGMSNVGVLVGASKSVAHQMQTQASQSISHAASEAMNFDSSRANQLSDGRTVSSSESATQAHSLDTMHSIAHDYAKKWGVSDNDAFSKVSQQSAYLTGRAETSAGFSLAGNGATATLGANVTATGTSDSKHTGSYAIDNSHSMSSSDMHRFSDALSSSQSYAKSHSLNSSMTNAERQSFAIGSSMNRAESLNESSSDILSNSSNFSANHTQDFVNYAESHLGSEQASQLLSSTSGSLYEQKQDLAQSYIKETYKGGHVNSNQMSYDVENYASKSNNGVASHGSGLGVSAGSLDSMDAMNSSAQAINQKIKAPIDSTSNDVESNIASGKAYAQKGVLHHELNAIEHPWKTIKEDT